MLYNFYNMYFIYGTEDFLIEQEKNRIINKFKIDPIVFDEDYSIENVIQELITVDIFSSEKLLVIKDGDAFKNKNISSKLLEIVKKTMNEIKIIFILTQDNPKSTNPLISFLMINANTLHKKQLSDKDVMGFIKEVFESKGIKISSKAIIELNNKLPNNLLLINNEIEKLSLLEKDIEFEDVEENISDYTSNDYFALSNAIMKKDRNGIFIAYEEAIRDGIEPTVLIAQISSVLLLTNQVNNYLAQGISSKDISEKTKIHIFRIKKAREFLNKIDALELKKVIVKLSQLESNIKKGIIDSNIGLEKFLLDYVK